MPTPPAARLRGLLELMIAEAADAPQHRRIELDLSFHTLICELSGNAYLLRLFSSTQTEMRMIISLIDNVYQDPEMVAATHQPILDALARRDVQAAQACMKYIWTMPGSTSATCSSRSMARRAKTKGSRKT